MALRKCTLGFDKYIQTEWSIASSQNLEPVGVSSSWKYLVSSEDECALCLQPCSSMSWQGSWSCSGLNERLSGLSHPWLKSKALSLFPFKWKKENKQFCGASYMLLTWLEELENKSFWWSLTGGQQALVCQLSVLRELDMLIDVYYS